MKELAAKLDQCSDQVEVHSTDISQLTNVDQSHLAKIQALENDINNLRNNLKELASQRQVLESAVDVPKGNNIDQETIERLQV